MAINFEFLRTYYAVTQRHYNTIIFGVNSIFIACHTVKHLLNTGHRL